MTPEEHAAYNRGIAETLGLIDTVAGIVPALVAPGVRDVSLEELAAALTRADRRSLATLRPYNPTEAISPKEAATTAGRSESCIKDWIDRFAIGRLVVGSLRISHPALLMLLDDDVLALGAYLSGDRGPIVRPYFDRAGCALRTPSFTG